MIVNANEPSPAELLFVLAFYGVLIFVAVAINLLICYLLYNSVKSLPKQFQQAPAGQAFLLMIPLFGLVWLFLYLPKVSRSFQEFFRVHRQQSDDCGEQLGLWWAILSACSIIPCVGFFTSILSSRLMSAKIAAIIGHQGGVRDHPPSKSSNPYDPPRQ